MSRLTRVGTAEAVSREQILRRERGQGNAIFIFPCSADHEQDWQPYPIDPYSAVCVTIHGVQSRSWSAEQGMYGPGVTIRKQRNEDCRPSLSFSPNLREKDATTGSMYSHAYRKSKDQPGKVANPAHGQLNRGNEYFPIRVRA